MPQHKLITEDEFRVALDIKVKSNIANLQKCDFVTGEGRSGALISVYLSHMLKIPFLPYGMIPENGTRLLLADTVKWRGRTLRKMQKKYHMFDYETFYVFDEPPILKFWYEK